MYSHHIIKLYEEIIYPGIWAEFDNEIKVKIIIVDKEKKQMEIFVGRI